MKSSNIIIDINFTRGMRRFLLLSCCLILFSVAYGQRGKRNYQMTEQDMVVQVLNYLQTKDVLSYSRMFPETDSVLFWSMQMNEQGSRAYMALARKLDDPIYCMRIDSALQSALYTEFDTIMQRGDGMGINWHALVHMRYELQRSRKVRDTLFEKLAPVRFDGYFFMMDMLTRKTYGVAVTDIMKIKDSWYGGRLRGIYQAATVDEYQSRRATELARIAKGLPGNYGLDDDELAVSDEEDEEDEPIRKMVVDRKLFAGTFDDEISVELYIRYLRGGCPEQICEWEGLFRFGDEDYMPVDISRTEDGMWMIEEADGNGVMILQLNGGHFTGKWSSTVDQTGYEVDILDQPVSNRKIRQLDGLLDSK